MRNLTMRIRLGLLGLLALQGLVLTPRVARADMVSLAGTWRFAMGPGVKSAQGPLPTMSFSDTIVLPGTTDENRKGPENSAREPGRLTRVHPYSGPAWYQRDVTVRPDWRGKRVVLFLERTKPGAAWVDDKALGSQDSLACPHVYDLTAALTPGTHRLTILVDNSRRPPVGDPHQLSDQTQTDWNGIIGRLELRIMPPVWIEAVQVYPDVAGRKARVRVTVGNMTGKTAEITLNLGSPGDKGLAKTPFEPVHQAVASADERSVVEVDCRMRSDARAWDEFDPACGQLPIELQAKCGDCRYEEREELPVGLRDFKVSKGRFTVNGRTTFLRGKHDACVFPLTGHPPMDEQGWLAYFETCRSYGINHVRFHTWCPP